MLIHLGANRPAAVCGYKYPRRRLANPQLHPLEATHDVFLPTDGPGWRGHVSHGITAFDHHTGSPFPVGCQYGEQGIDAVFTEI